MNSSPPKPSPSYNYIRPKRSSKKIIFGITLFISLGFTYPFYQHYLNTKSNINYWYSDKPLNVNVVQRGAYLNTGSKDIGLDKPLEQILRESKKKNEIMEIEKEK
jgi:hypothetical protein